MELTCAAIQTLGLRSAPERIDHTCMRAVVVGTQALQRRMQSSVGEHVSYKNEYTYGQICTWRPKYCLDMFMYLHRDLNRSFVGLALNGPVNGVGYYTYDSVITLPPNLHAVLLLCHITCDVDERDNEQMAVLVYDGIDVSALCERGKSLPLATDRCTWVQQTLRFLNGVSIGEARLTVQWTGSPTAYKNILELDTPHAKGAFVLVGPDIYSYVVHKIDNKDASVDKKDEMPYES